MMKFEKIFRAVKNGNDVRGAVIASGTEAVTLTPDMVSCIAFAFAEFLARKTGKEKAALRIGVGHDSRISAEKMKKACLRGLSQLHSYDCGLITTPAMFQSTLLPESHFDGAVMLTASHLPFNRNGMKFFTVEGAISGADLGDVLSQAILLAENHGSESEVAVGDNIGDIGGRKEGTAEAESFCLLTLPHGNIAPETFDMQALYCAHMQEIMRKEVAAENFQLPLEGLHIVVDAGNGAAGFFAHRILEPLGADISGSVYLDPDGHFPNHVPNPENREAMDAARRAVLEAGADLGVIFDCDGDRGAVVFSDGTEVNRNTLIALLSAIVAEQHPNSWIVTDSVTSDELADFLTKELKLKHLRYKRGYKNVIDRAIELNQEGEDCELAIETSGHGAFRENHFSDDGAYIAVKIICRMARLLKENKRIEALIAALCVPAESSEVRFRIEEEDFKTYGNRVLEEFRSFAEQQPGFCVVTPNYEGIRVAVHDEEAQGWLLLRMSLHDPVMPLNLETKEDGGTKHLMERLQPFFSRYKKLTIV